MEPASISQRLRDRYLGLLGVQVSAPRRQELARLVRAQLERVPFENISKIHYRERSGLTGMVDLEQYLDGIARSGFGGTCVSNSLHFFNLLAGLGYEVELCGADMSCRNAHLAITATVDGGQYLIDVGYGAPFFAPLPLDLPTEVAIRFGGDRYLLAPRDEEGNSRLDFFRGDERVHGYLLRPQPLSADDFAACVELTFVPDATFFNAILLVGFDSGRGVRIHNLSLSEMSPAGRASRELAGRDELVAAIIERFGMPEEIVRGAVESVETFGEIYT